MSEEIADYIVTRVRKERSHDGTHEHIEGVCTTNGIHYTREEVVASINAGELWKARAGGREAPIEVIPYCPLHPGCGATPYITTRRDESAEDNLENLERC